MTYRKEIEKITDFMQVESTKSGVLRIGVLQEGFEECDDIIVKCIKNAINLIKSSNKFVEVTEVSIPDHSKGIMFSGYDRSLSLLLQISN